MSPAYRRIRAGGFVVIALVIFVGILAVDSRFDSLDVDETTATFEADLERCDDRIQALASAWHLVAIGEIITAVDLVAAGNEPGSPGNRPVNLDVAQRAEYRARVLVQINERMIVHAGELDPSEDTFTCPEIPDWLSRIPSPVPPVG